MLVALDQKGGKSWGRQEMKRHIWHCKTQVAIDIHPPDMNVREVKLRSVEYQIIYKKCIALTKIFDMKIKLTSVCNFLNQIEDVDNILYSCMEVQNF